MAILYTDGETAHNGQHGRQKSSICVTDEEGNVLIEEFIGDKTNIEAEATGILRAMEHAEANKIVPLSILTDSKFWVDAIKGRWRLKVTRLYPLRDKLYETVDRIKPHIVWIPREQNLAGIYFENKSRKSPLKTKEVICPKCEHHFTVEDNP